MSMSMYINGQVNLGGTRTTVLNLTPFFSATDGPLPEVSFDSGNGNGIRVHCRRVMDGTAVPCN